MVIDSYDLQPTYSKCSMNVLKCILSLKGSDSSKHCTIIQTEPFSTIIAPRWKCRFMSSLNPCTWM